MNAEREHAHEESEGGQLRQPSLHANSCWIAPSAGNRDDHMGHALFTQQLHYRKNEIDTTLQDFTLAKIDSVQSSVDYSLPDDKDQNQVSDLTGRRHVPYYQLHRTLLEILSLLNFLFGNF